MKGRQVQERKPGVRDRLSMYDQDTGAGGGTARKAVVSSSRGLVHTQASQLDTPVFDSAWIKHSERSSLVILQKVIPPLSAFTLKLNQSLSALCEVTS